MGCVTSTAKRRRRQIAGGYKHLDKMRRPNYPHGPGTMEAAAKREARWRANANKPKKSK